MGRVFFLPNQDLESLYLLFVEYLAVQHPLVLQIKINHEIYKNNHL